MSRSKSVVRAALAVSAGLALASPGFSDESAIARRTAPQSQPSGTTTGGTARQDTTRTMPTWDAFGESETESVAETVYRLNREFLSTSEYGVRRLSAVPIWPRGDMKIGPVRIIPYLRQGVEYESNFYHVHRTGDRGSELAHDAAWTHQNQIGALSDLALMGGRLRLAASADAEWDVRYDEGNEDRGTRANGNLVDPEKADNFEFHGEFGASYRFPSGAYVRGGLAYERRSDPIDADVISREFNRTNRRSFLVAGLDRDIVFGSKFRFELGMNVRDTIGREEGLDDLDRTETTYYLKASYPFWKNTTRLFGRARYRQDERESEFINDGDVWGFDAGIEGSIPLREGEYRGLRGQVSIGFDHALYDDDARRSGAVTVHDDDNRRNTNLAFSALLQYLMSRKTTIDLRYLRTNQFSFHGNYQIVDRFDLSVIHNITPRLAGRVATFFEYTDPSGRVSPAGQPGGDRSEYPSSTRFGAGFGLRYKLNEWLDADMNYDWERRNNRFTGFGNHRASLGVTVYLNALKPSRRGDDDAATAMAVSDATPARRTSGAAAASRTVPAERSSGGTKTTVAPTAPAARPMVSVQPQGSVVVDRAPGGGDEGQVIRLRDGAARARIEFGDGASLQVAGPATVRILEVRPGGYRVQLVSGTITEARVLGTALEIQTPADASLVLQNATATARVEKDSGVMFRSMGGEYVRVHHAGSARDPGTQPWTLAPGR